MKFLKCEKHPLYKGLRKPTAICPPCQLIWQVTQSRKLREDAATHMRSIMFREGKARF